MKKKTGIAKEGNRFSVLQSFISKIPNPEAAIKIPPTIETSVIKASGITFPTKEVNR